MRHSAPGREHRPHARPLRHQPGDRGQGRPHRRDHARRDRHHLPRTAREVQDAGPEAVCGRHPGQHLRVRRGPRRNGQDLSGHRHGRGGAEEQGDREDHPDAPGSGGRREAGLPARRPRAEGRPLSAPAVRRAARDAGRGRVSAAGGARRGGGGSAGLHARPHAQRRVHHPRRGAEHHVRADEDVPDPHGHGLEDGHHRRRDSDRPADGQAVGSGGGAGGA